MAKVKPQVIDDEEHERVYERVAAVDVAKDTGMVCTRMPHPSRPDSRQSAVWTVKARMTAIGTLRRQLKRDGIEMVTLESTSDYWRIWFFVLEAAGLASLFNLLCEQGPSSQVRAAPICTGRSAPAGSVGLPGAGGRAAAATDQGTGQGCSRVRWDAPGRECMSQRDPAFPP